MLNHCGISYEADLLDMAIADKIIQQSGSWFSYGKIKLGQGREKARTFLEENPDKCVEVRKKVLAARGFPDPDTPAQPDANGEADADSKD